MTFDPTIVPDESRYFANLDDLVAWKSNYNEGDIGMIMTSIVAYGYNRTISVWQNNVVMAGNHTMQALKMCKKDGFLPRTFAPIAWFKDGDRDHVLPEYAARIFDDSGNILVDGNKWFVHISDCSHMPYERAVAYAVADNEAAKRALQDEKLLLAHLREVEQYAADTGDNLVLLGTGYDKDEIEFLEQLIQDDDKRSLDQLGDDTGESGKTGDELNDDMTTDPVIKIQVPPDVYQRYTDLMNGAKEDEKPDRFAEILFAVNDHDLSWNQNDPE